MERRVRGYRFKANNGRYYNFFGEPTVIGKDAAYVFRAHEMHCLLNESLGHKYQGKWEIVYE